MNWKVEITAAASAREEAALETPRKSGRPWIEGAEISSRPSEAADRAIPGHWEGDHRYWRRQQSCLITLIERRSRFLLMSRLCSHDAQSVSERLIEMVEGIPEELKAHAYLGTKVLRWPTLPTSS